MTEILRSPTANTMGDILSEELYADLYAKVRDKGLPYFARVNEAGTVELYVVYEQIEAFHEAMEEHTTLECRTYREKLLMVIWTISDPRHPLGYPLTFDCSDEQERILASTLASQDEIHLHHLWFSGNLLIHIYTDTINWSAGEKRRAKQLIEHLSEPINKEKGTVLAEEVREEPIASRSAILLPAEQCCKEGIAYLFDYAELVKKHGGETGAHGVVMNALNQALLVMRRHARSEVRETTFTIWVAELSGVLKIYLAPGLSDVFAVVHESEDDLNPFSKFLLAIPEFLRTEETEPLAEGAYPILMFEHSRLYHLELDLAVQQRLGELFAEMYPDAYKNPYVLMK